MVKTQVITQDRGGEALGILGALTRLSRRFRPQQKKERRKDFVVRRKKERKTERNFRRRRRRPPRILEKPTVTVDLKLWTERFW